MGWATSYIARLKEGQTVQLRPRGQSMAGLIDSGQLVTIEPVTDLAIVQPNDIVLCNVHGSQFLHLVKAKRGERFQIGNNHGRLNGWTSTIYGRVIAVAK